MKNKTTLRRFYDYDLSPEQLESFQESIQDNNMSRSYNNYKFSEQLSSELMHPGYNQTVAEKGKYIFENLPHVNRRSRNIFSLKILSVAACIVALIAMMFLITNRMSSVDVHMIAKQSAESALSMDALTAFQRSETATENQILSDYSAGLYYEVVDKVADSDENELYLLLKSRAFLELGQLESSKEILDKIDENIFEMKDALLWSYIEVELKFLPDSKEELVSHLQELIKNKYPNYNNAEKILKSIN